MASNDSILPRRTDESAASELQHCRCGADMCGAKLLACLHVLGTCCLKVEKRQEREVLQCTQCLHETLVPEGKLELLPSPTFLQNLKAAELEKQGKKPQCGICKKEADAIARCQDCNEFICETHKDIHSEVPALRHHAIFPVKDTTSKPDIAAQSLCRKHGSPLRLYCQPCSVAICADCKMFGDHCDHDHVELCTKLQNVEKDIRDRLEALKLKETEQQSPDAADSKIESKVDNLGTALERQIGAMLDEDNFTRRRIEQVLATGSEEERLLLHQMLQLPKERYARVTQKRTALITSDMDTKKLRISPVEGALNTKGIRRCVHSDELSDEQKMQHLKVGSLILWDQTVPQICRVTEVNEEEESWRLCDVEDHDECWYDKGFLERWKLLDHYVPL